MVLYTLLTDTVFIMYIANMLYSIIFFPVFGFQIYSFKKIIIRTTTRKISIPIEKSDEGTFLIYIYSIGKKKTGSEKLNHFLLLPQIFKKISMA